MQPVTPPPLMAGHLPAVQPIPPAAPPAASPIGVEPPPADTAPSASPSIREVEEATSRVEKFVQPISSDLQFSIDEASGTPVVRVIDRNTQELIRQIPSEEMLAIAQALDRLQGLLVRQKA